MNVPNYEVNVKEVKKVVKRVTNKWREGKFRLHWSQDENDQRIVDLEVYLGRVIKKSVFGFSVNKD